MNNSRKDTTKFKKRSTENQFTFRIFLFSLSAFYTMDSWPRRLYRTQSKQERHRCCYGQHSYHAYKPICYSTSGHIDKSQRKQRLQIQNKQMHHWAVGKAFQSSCSPNLQLWGPTWSSVCATITAPTHAYPNSSSRHTLSLWVCVKELGEGQLYTDTHVWKSAK